MRNERRAALQALAAQYGDAAQRARFSLTVTPGDGTRNYSVSVLGVIREQRQLIVTAPVTADNSLITVIKGHALVCRWFNATTAFRFRAIISRVAFEPSPLLYLEVPETIERKVVRRLPRALANLHALVRLPEAIEALVVDLSVSGARIAITATQRVENGQRFELSLRPRLLDRSFLLAITSVITNVMGVTDPANPNVQFLGVEFRDVPESDLLILHACVQEQLALEADWLTQLLNVGAQLDTGTHGSISVSGS